MLRLQAERTPVDRLDATTPPADPQAEVERLQPRVQPARVIEVGEVTAGITVPEARGVRFFSSSRDFDGLDGTVFRNAEQATRAVRERVRTLAHHGGAGAQRLRSA